MFALVGLLALIFVDYMRPQEYVEALKGVPVLHLATVLAALGLVLDLRLGLARLRAAPHAAHAVLFASWCAVTLLVRVPGQLASRATGLLVPLAIYLLVAHAVQSFRMLQVLCGFLLAIALALAGIGIHQANASEGCHLVVHGRHGGSLIHDGRPCVDHTDCERDSDDPGAEYRCEKVGLLGTSTVFERVRYRGTLEDPNELSLALGIAIPFSFALFDRRRSFLRLLLVAVTVGAIGACAIYTRSRGGQLVFLTVLAVYFVNQIGAKRGLVAGLILALPLLLLGGRSGVESSTKERIECWWTGLHLFQAFPLTGVGWGQFAEHHHLTAHNSWVLAAAELGLPGLLIWSSIVYVAVKILVRARRADLPPVARSWALALLASMAGLLVGIFFLSYAYKDVLWIYVGLTGVLYQAVKRHDPGFRIEFGLRDLGLVALVDGALLLALVGYTGSKLGW